MNLCDLAVVSKYLKLQLIDNGRNKKLNPFISLSVLSLSVYNSSDQCLFISKSNYFTGIYSNQMFVLLWFLKSKILQSNFCNALFFSSCSHRVLLAMYCPSYPSYLPGLKLGSWTLKCYHKKLKKKIVSLRYFLLITAVGNIWSHINWQKNASFSFSKLEELEKMKSNGKIFSSLGKEHMPSRKWGFNQFREAKLKVRRARSAICQALGNAFNFVCMRYENLSDLGL